jgi:hypothetical protein
MARQSWARVAAALVIAGLMVVAWGIVRSRQPTPLATNAEPALVSERRQAPPAQATPLSGAAEPPTSHAGGTGGEAMAPSEDEDEPVEPHPISDERTALAPPWGTFRDVKAALEARDFERARDILEQRRSADPRAEDWLDFYTGLELMGECLESPSAASRARAEEFIAEYRASPLRRHVRRKCQIGYAARAK